MMSEKIQGVFPAMVVPFSSDESIDESAFRNEARYLLGTGVDGISSGGSTGEGAVLSDSELLRCLEIVQEENSSKKPLIAGIIKNSTREVLSAAQDAKTAGADVLLVTPVYYHGATEEGNYEYFKRITGETGLPVIIYNVVAANLISPESFVKMAEIDGILGIKQVDPVKLAEIASICPDGKKVYAATDQMLYSCYVAGASGAISALVTIAPDLCVEQWQAYKNGNQQRAMEIQRDLVPLVRLYLERPFPGKVKELIRLQGRPTGVTRHPILPSSGAILGLMKKELSAAGLA